MALSKKQRREQIRKKQEATVRFKKRAKLTTIVAIPVLASAALISSMAASFARNSLPDKPRTSQTQTQEKQARSWEEEVNLWHEHELSDPVTYQKVVRSQTYKEWGKDKPFVIFSDARRRFVENPSYTNYQTEYFVGLKDRLDFFFNVYHDIYSDFFLKQKNLGEIALFARNFSDLDDSQALPKILNLAYFLTRSNIRAKQLNTPSENKEDMKQIFTQKLEQGYGECTSNSFVFALNFQRIANQAKKQRLMEKIRITRGFQPSQIRLQKIDHGWIEYFHKGEWYLLECNGTNGPNGNQLFGQSFDPRQNCLQGVTAPISHEGVRDYVRLCSMVFDYQHKKTIKYNLVYHTIPQDFEDELVAKSQ